MKAGTSISTAQFYSDGTAVAGGTSTAPGVTPTAHQGSVWARVCKDLAVADLPIPPPVGAQTALQRALATSSMFEQASSNGETPPLVSNHMKLPHYQLLKSAVGVDEDPRVATDHPPRKGLHRAGRSLPQGDEVEATAIRFADALAAYCTDVITSSGSANTDRFDACISLLKTAFRNELQDLNLDFTARQKKINEDKVQQQLVVATARADSEMKDATDNIAELMMATAEKVFKSHFPNTYPPLSKAPKPTPPETASSSNDQPRNQSRNSKPPAAKNQGNGKRDGQQKAGPKPSERGQGHRNDRRGGGARNTNDKKKSNEPSAKAKGKKKAKDESSDNDSP
ncbi:hypothetical protein B0H17DRAFT_1204485 [Mycena rosella]|uniref:Uncharacterized protein n=1 Tax=Mycena rosella TaxID=1033263 RepID=A0AAD7D9A1_MYCRO|nr:hypothetical protein B0H17DRAFT_1204485 [Mycena rosella]